MRALVLEVYFSTDRGAPGCKKALSYAVPSIWGNADIERVLDSSAQWRISDVYYQMCRYLSVFSHFPFSLLSLSFLSPFLSAIVRT